jgi:RimJ/RimL family protein N-acetyltransferase
MTAQLWPLFGLAVTTPRLSLRYIDDDLGTQLAELAAGGIHDPETMPFAQPWTDVAPPELERNTLRYYWRSRAETTREHWDLNLAVGTGDTVVGMCSIHSDGFPATRTAATGSWLGRRFQGQGLGREMRRAALHLIFAGLGADRATTSAWHDNAGSLGVTRSLGYEEAGARKQLRRDRLDTMRDFSMTRSRWRMLNVGNDIALTGIAPAREFLGATRN